MGMSMCVSPPCFHASVLSIPHVSNDGSHWIHPTDLQSFHF